MNRLSVMGGEDSNGIDASRREGLQSILNSINPYTKLFRNARDRILQNPAQNFHIRILHNRGQRQYNRSTTSEIAALIDGTE